MERGELINLIIVPGHGVYIGEKADDVGKNDKWVRIFEGEGSYYAEHVKEGVKLAHINPNSLLVFSGGKTRYYVSDEALSEARSYKRIAEQFKWWGYDVIEEHIALEEYARDSFENLLFSICCFRGITEKYPETITIVGWAFKSERYELHRRAIRFPGGDRFKYFGVNNPSDKGSPSSLSKAIQGEEKKLQSVRDDPFLLDITWQKQREKRNPFNQQHNYHSVAPELSQQLNSLMMGEVLFEKLPWETG